MQLLEHQIVLGRCLRAADGDPLASLAALQGIVLDRTKLAELHDLRNRSGFRFTRRGRRSWCEGRTAEAAQLTLSILPAEQRRQLVNDWVDAGGGTTFDPVSETDAFLEFAAGHLSEPSHAMTICRMEQAAYRASPAALRFKPPDLSLLDHPKTMLCAGKGAVLVRFFAEPQRLFAAIEAKAQLPPRSDRCFFVLFETLVDNYQGGRFNRPNGYTPALSRNSNLPVIGSVRAYVQDGEQLLPQGWADYAVTATHTGTATRRASAPISPLRTLQRIRRGRSHNPELVVSRPDRAPRATVSRDVVRAAG
jgi:hypothetical protein